VETVLFQALPIQILKGINAPNFVMITVSTTLFGCAHLFQNGVLSGISAGLIGGLGLAWIYLRGMQQSTFTALWTTSLSHIIRNSVVLVLFWTFPSPVQSVSYDFFCHPRAGSAWYFYDVDGNVICALLDVSQTSSLSMSHSPNTPFSGDVEVQYPDGILQLSVKETKVMVQNVEYSLATHQLFEVRHEQGSIVAKSLGTIKTSSGMLDKSTVIPQLERWLWKLQPSR
jgi:hypothetical protein